MTPQYVRGLSGKTINLPADNIISEDNNGYHEIWLTICEERKKAIQEYERKRGGRVLQQTKSKKEKATSFGIMEKAKKRLQNLFIDPELKCKYYYALIDLLGPLYVDRRGENLRGKLQKIFDITEKEERAFIAKMLTENLVNIVGGICFINDRQKARDIQNEMLTRGAIDLKTILTLST